MIIWQNNARKMKPSIKFNILLNRTHSNIYVISVLIFLIFSRFLLSGTNQENQPVTGQTKSLTIEFIDEKIKIDGHLNENIYKTLTPVEDFVQFHPKNGTPPTFKTRVYAFYNKNNIYFSFECFDDEPKKITADVTPFDQYSYNDDVRVYIDPFGDSANYDYFIVNPRGIMKGKNTVWYADAHITPNGWCAEIRIPFKSLRFPVKDIQKWKVNFMRSIFRLNEMDFWTSITRDQYKNNFNGTFGDLEGISHIKGGKNIEIYPYVGVRTSRLFGEKDDKFAYGLDLKYGITSNLTLDLTSSPDYSQVESDPFFYQLSPTEYNLTENRPFYSEGSTYLDTVFDLFYSRRITNPTLAVKVTGKEKGYSIGLLAANNHKDDNNRFHGVFRLKKDLPNLSYVGVIYSAIEDNDNWNRNVGADFKFKFKKIYSVSGMAAYAFNKNISRQNNGLYRLQFSRSVDKGFSYTGLFQRIEHNVSIPAGYIGRRDYTRYYSSLKYSFRWEGKWIESLSFLNYLTYENSTSDKSTINKSGSILIDILTRSRIEWLSEFYFGKIKANVYNEQGSLIWEDKFYDSFSFSHSLSYYGNQKIQGGVTYYFIDDFVYSDDFTYTTKGRFHELSSWANLKINPQLQWGWEFKRTTYHSDDHTIKFKGSLLSSTVQYQLSKKLASFLKFQYDSDGNRFQYDFLVGYEMTNLSKFIISFKNYSEDRFRLFSKDARTITVKFSYLIRI